MEPSVPGAGGQAPSAPHPAVPAAIEKAAPAVTELLAGALSQPPVQPSAIIPPAAADAVQDDGTSKKDEKFALKIGFVSFLLALTSVLAFLGMTIGAIASLFALVLVFAPELFKRIEGR
ncbi:hypothetical protein ABGB12_34800 [Actinocorallia sp. B10E7]